MTRHGIIQRSAAGAQHSAPGQRVSMMTADAELGLDARSRIDVVVINDCIQDLRRPRKQLTRCCAKPLPFARSPLPSAPSWRSARRGEIVQHVHHVMVD